jgi:hypothetical protein
MTSNDEFRNDELRQRFMGKVFGVRYDSEGVALCDQHVPFSSKLLSSQQYTARIALLEKWHSMPSSTKEECASWRKFRQKNRQGYRFAKLYRVETNERTGGKELRRLKGARSTSSVDSCFIIKGSTRARSTSSVDSCFLIDGSTRARARSTSSVDSCFLIKGSTRARSTDEVDSCFLIQGSTRARSTDEVDACFLIKGSTRARSTGEVDTCFLSFAM